MVGWPIWPGKQPAVANFCCNYRAASASNAGHAADGGGILEHPAPQWATAVIMPETRELVKIE